MRELDLTVEDEKAKENFQSIQDDRAAQRMPNFRWEFFEESFEVGSNQKFKHNLSFTPKDYMVTGVSTSSATFTLHPESFDKDFIYFTVTGADCSVRFLLGSYVDESGDIR